MKENVKTTGIHRILQLVSNQVEIKKASSKARPEKLFILPQPYIIVIILKYMALASDLDIIDQRSYLCIEILQGNSRSSIYARLWYVRNILCKTSGL